VRACTRNFYGFANEKVRFAATLGAGFVCFIEKRRGALPGRVLILGRAPGFVARIQKWQSIVVFGSE
jgi:hypothetical protein